MSLSLTGLQNYQAQDTSGVISFTTGAFTPADDSILVVHCGVVNGAGGADVRSGMVLSGGGLTWTRQAGPTGGTVSGYTAAQEIWTAKVTTGASMQLTYSHSGNVGSDRAWGMIQVHEITSDSASPEIGTPNVIVGAHDQGDAAASLTLPSAPAASSIVSAARHYNSNGGDGAATEGSGWTEVYDQTASTNGYGSMQSQYRGGSTSTSVDWANLMVPGETAWKSSAMAIEVRETTTGDMTASGGLSISGSADLNAPANITAVGAASITGSASLTALGALLAAGALAIGGSASLTAVGDISAAGAATITGTADLNAPGNITAVGAVAIVGAAALSSPGDVVAAGGLSITGAATLNATGTMAATGSASISGAADSQATGSMNAAGGLSITGAATMQDANAIIGAVGHRVVGMFSTSEHQAVGIFGMHQVVGLFIGEGA